MLPVGNQISPASLTRSTTACARSGSTAPLSHGSASAPCPSWATSRWHRKTRSFWHSPTSATPTCTCSTCTCYPYVLPLLAPQESTSRFDGKGGQLNLLLNLLRTSFAPPRVSTLSRSRSSSMARSKESKHDAVLSKLAVEHAPHGKLINNHGKMRPCYVEARKQCGEEGVMSGKLDLLGGGDGWGRGALSHDRTATDATCERNIYVAKAQIAHATTRTYIRCNEPSDGRRTSRRRRS